MFEQRLQIDDVVTGLVVGPSRWIDITQTRIDAFAEATEDKQWIHIDPLRASESAFGQTIAHGYLTLALLAPFSYDLLPIDASVILNYGLDRARFPAPVPSGSRLRAQFTVADVQAIEGGIQAYVDAVIEIENGEKPACVARLIFRYYR